MSNKSNISIRDGLYVDMSIIVNFLYQLQADHQIIERDHYYHSIQCFLLAIVLFKKFYPSQQVPKNIIATLYSLTIYHDIGYMYKSKKIPENRINKSLEEIFLCSNIFYESEIIKILCLRDKPYQSNKYFDDNIIESIKGNDDIKKIWSSQSSIGNNLFEFVPGLTTSSVDYKKNHAYHGALLLTKVHATKKILSYNSESVTNITINDEKADWFKEVIKAIYNHGHETFSLPLNKTSDFYSVYLMIIDELQTYGRLLSEDTKHALINPKDVGFHWDTVYPNKLVSDIITTDPKLVKECSVHNCRKIKSKLRRKIDKKSLGII